MKLNNYSKVQGCTVFCFRTRVEQSNLLAFYADRYLLRCVMLQFDIYLSLVAEGRNYFHSLVPVQLFGRLYSRVCFF